MRKYLIWQLALLSFVLTACTSPSPPPAATLRIAFSQFPTTLNPRKSGDFISSTLICLIYEGLTRCLPDGSVEPALAARIDVSADQTVYTFHLKEAVWSDGQPVSAWDFERSWKQALDPESPSLCAYLFYPILGAEAIAHGTLAPEKLGVIALDAKTLEVRLERPTPHFLALTAFPSFLPTSARSEKIVNGPFFIDQFAPQAKIGLRKNPLFWNAKKTALTGIDIHIIPEETTALKMFEQGELDWLGGALSPIPSDALEELCSTSQLTFYPIAASTFCTFNTNEYPFHNEHIRKAFDLAIDRTAIATHVLHGTQTAATSLVPPTLWAKEPTVKNLFDPEKARWHLLKGCEELQITNLEPVTFSVRTSYTDRLLSQILQRQWKEVLGVHVMIHRTDTKSLKHLLHERNYQVALTNWIAQYPDPMNILERFRAKDNAKNYPAWENRGFLALLDAAQQTLDATERTAFLTQAEQMLETHSPIALIYHWQVPSLCHPRVKNMMTTPSGGVLFERVWLES